MKARNLLILVILAGALVGAALLSSRRDQAAPPTEIGKPLLETLAVNDVTSLSIATQSATAVVSRVEGRWVVPAKRGYAADFDKVRRALIALSELTIGDRVTVGEGKRAELGLAPPVGSKTESRRVELADAAGKTLATLLLGVDHMRSSAGASPRGGFPDGRYVSPDEGKTIYMVTDRLYDFSEQPLNWLDTSLVNVSRDDVVHISVTGSGRAPLELTRSATGSALECTGLSEDEEVDAAELSTLQNAMAYITLKDLADPTLGDADMGLDDPTHFEARTRYLTYRIDVGGQAEGDSRYARFSAEAHEAADPGEAESEGEAENEPDPAFAEARTQADALNAKVKDWVYILPDYKANALIMTRETLVKKKKPSESDSTEEDEE